MASSFWKHIVDKSDGSPCIHVVFDNYFIEGSIKSQTRERRGEQLTPSNAPSHLQPNMTVTDWKKCLTSCSSKREITHLYTKHIASHAIYIVKPGKVVIESGGFGIQTLKVTHDCVSYVKAVCALNIFLL